MCIVQQTFLLIVDDTICIHINVTQDCERTHYIINPALPWYVYLITAILITLFIWEGGLYSIATGTKDSEKSECCAIRGEPRFRRRGDIQSPCHTAAETSPQYITSH